MEMAKSSSGPSYPLDHEIPFEVFHKGSWHPADLISIYDGNISVQTKNPIPMVLVNIHTDFLRMRSRKATSLDCCNFLRPGIDVCVLLPRPASLNSDIDSHPMHLVWVDARIIKIKRSHADTCNCAFAVMPYKCDESDDPMHMQNLVCDPASITLVKINHISILQRLCHEPDKTGNIFPSSTKNVNSINKTKLFNFTDTFSPAIATLLAFSTLCSVIDVKVLQDRIVYHVQEDVNQNGSTVDMKIVNFINCDGVIRPKIERLPIEATCTKEQGIPPGDIEESFAVFSADNVYEEMGIRRSKRERNQRDFLACHMSPSCGRSSYAPSANAPSSSKSQPKKELANEEVTLQNKHKVVQKEEERRHYLLHKKCGAKRKSYFCSKECDDFIEELEDPGMQNEMPAYQLHKKHGAKGNYFSTENLLSDFPSPSKSRPKKELANEEVTFRSKPAARSSSVKGNSKHKVVQKDKERRHSWLFKKCGAKRKSYFSSKECDEFIEELVKDPGMQNEMPAYRLHKKPGAKGNYFNKEHVDLIDELMKDQGMLKTRGWLNKPNAKHGAKRKYTSTKECDDFIEELMTDIRCCMSEKAKLGIQQEEEACASVPGYFPIEEDFTWPPTDSDGQIDKEKEKDEYKDLWEEMDNCLYMLAIEEEKKNSDSVDEEATEENKESCVHDCVRNEQIGLICKKCNVVQTEIRDIFPPMMKEQSHQMPTDRPSSRNEPFDLDPSFLKTPPNPNLSKSCKNIWTLIHEIEPKLQPHQRRAFEFMWKNLDGCVISHSPGSGKTLTVIAFLLSYLKMFPQNHPLVLTPKSAIHVWEREFKKWNFKFPVHVIHRDIAFPKRTLIGKAKGYLDSEHRPSDKTLRIMDSLEKVRLWHENPGVLLMTYSSFRSLMKEGSGNEYYEFMANVLQSSPGLLVLDEGHTERSTSSKLRRLLMKVKTDSRILLSGTVFQNNFEEYYNTLCLARPRFMTDVISEFENKRWRRKPKDVEKYAQRLFVEKIGHKIQSHDILERKHGFDLLRKMTSGFINTYNGEKLQNLPGLETYTIFLQSTKPQERILQKLQSKLGSRCSLDVEVLVSVGAIHPCLVGSSKAAPTFFTGNELKEIGRQRKFSKGSKTSFVIDVINRSLMTKERVLVFCHNLAPLKLLIELIGSEFGWCEGNEILFLYGDQDLSVRSEIIDKFNGDKEGKRKVLLASTNACAEGISLTAASRIVLLDSEWNHSKTKQAIARAFRPGQEKMVYAYLLLAAGSWEENIYESNKKKAQVSKMVLSGQCTEDSSARVVNAGDISDELLREIVEEDKNRTVKMVVKHD